MKQKKSKAKQIEKAVRLWVERDPDGLPQEVIASAHSAVCAAHREAEMARADIIAPGPLQVRIAAARAFAHELKRLEKDRGMRDFWKGKFCVQCGV